MLRKPKILASTFFIFLLGAASPAYASLDAPSGPAQSVTQTYNIAYPWDDADNGCDWVELQQSSNNGQSWTYKSDPEKDGVVEFVNQPIGIYKYRSMAWCEDYYGDYSWEEYSDTITVISGATPVVDHWSDQMDYEYEVRYDGADDVFVHRTTASATPGNGSIDTLILHSDGNGSFTSSVPTASQEATASSWSLAPGIDVRVFDVNVDGHVDVGLINIGSIVTGAEDQILFSSGAIYQTAPANILEIDQNLRDFSSDLLEYYNDPDYFSDIGQDVEDPGHWETTVECEWVWRMWESWEQECDTYVDWIDGDEYTLYVGVEERAANVWKAIESVITGEVLPGYVKGIFKVIFGVTVGTFELFSICDDFGVIDSPLCEQLIINVMIANLSKMVEATPIPNNTVYLTRHRVGYLGPYHTAIEYKNPVGLKAVMSAGPSGTIPLGNLKAAPNRPSDLLNVYAATLTSSLYSLPSLHFVHLEAMQIAYITHSNDCLPYKATSPFAANEYNSNSYVAGLIDVTSSVFPFGHVMGWYVGGEKPVPGAYFTSGSSCP